MTMQELGDHLRQNAVSEDAYSLGSFRDSAVSILHLGGLWYCVLEEKGTLLINREFYREEEVCEFAADILV